VKRADDPSTTRPRRRSAQPAHRRLGGCSNSCERAVDRLACRRWRDQPATVHIPQAADASRSARRSAAAADSFESNSPRSSRLLASAGSLKHPGPCYAQRNACVLRCSFRRFLRRFGCVPFPLSKEKQWRGRRAAWLWLLGTLHRRRLPQGDQRPDSQRVGAQRTDPDIGQSRDTDHSIDDGCAARRDDWRERHTRLRARHRSMRELPGVPDVFAPLSVTGR
jgi:hypothetical protein